MKFATRITTLILLATSVAYGADEVNWRRDVGEAVREAKKDGKLVLVFITGPKT